MHGHPFWSLLEGGGSMFSLGCHTRCGGCTVTVHWLFHQGQNNFLWKKNTVRYKHEIKDRHRQWNNLYVQKEVTNLLSMVYLPFVLSSSCPLSKWSSSGIPSRSCWSSIIPVNKLANLSVLSLLGGGPPPVVNLSLLASTFLFFKSNFMFFHRVYEGRYNSI